MFYCVRPRFRRRRGRPDATEHDVVALLRPFGDLPSSSDLGEEWRRTEVTRGTIITPLPWERPCAWEREETKTCAAHSIWCSCAQMVELSTCDRAHSQCGVFSGYDLQRKLGRAALFGGRAQGVFVPTGKKDPLLLFSNEVMKAVPEAVHFGFGLRYGPRDPQPSPTSLLHILLKQQEADFEVRDPFPFFFRNHG